jgi:hypothetical protein
MDIPVADTDGAPQVKLGDRLWAVPQLAARQNKIIDPLILSLLPIFVRWQRDKASALADIGAPQYEALQEIAFQAIRRAQPDITREQFLDLPVSLPELVAAFPIIAQQTGVFERGAPGEAMAGMAPPYPTGTPSSPMSAT